MSSSNAQKLTNLSLMENVTGAGPDENTDNLTRQKLWTRDFFIVTFENFLVAMNFFLMFSVLAKFATDRFCASSTLAGFSAGIFIIGALITRPLCGKWIHRVGQARMLYGGVMLSLAFSLAYFAIDSVGLLLLIPFLQGRRATRRAKGRRETERSRIAGTE